MHPNKMKLFLDNGSVALRDMGRFLRRAAHSSACQIAFCLLVPAVISVFFYQYKKRNYTRTEVAGNYVAAAEAPKWSFDEIRLKDGRYEIAGWITDEPRNGFWLKPRIVLVPLHQNKAIEIRTRMVLRKDISAKMGIAEGLNFMGFRAVIRKKYIPVEDGARIMISVERNGKRVLVDTGRSLPVDV